MLPPMNTDLLTHLPETHRVKTAAEREAARLCRAAPRTDWPATLARRAKGLARFLSTGSGAAKAR